MPGIDHEQVRHGSEFPPVAYLQGELGDREGIVRVGLAAQRDQGPRPVGQPEVGVIVGVYPHPLQGHPELLARAQEVVQVPARDPLLRLERGHAAAAPVEEPAVPLHVVEARLEGYAVRRAPGQLPLVGGLAALEGLVLPAETDFVRETPGAVGLKGAGDVPSVPDLEGPGAERPAIVEAGGFVTPPHPDFRTVVQTVRLVHPHPASHPLAARVACPVQAHARPPVADPAEVRTLRAQTVPVPGQVVPVQVSHVIQFEVFVEVVHGQAVRQSLPRCVRQVHETAVPARAGDVRRHPLPIRLPASVSAQEVPVERLHVGGSLETVRVGRHPADGPVRTLAALVEQAHRLEVPAVLAEALAAPVGIDRSERRLVLHRGEDAPPQAAVLARCLRGAEQLGRPGEGRLFHGTAVRQRRPLRRRADAPRVQEQERGGGAAPERARPRRSDEDLLALLEEQPLLREERLERGQVHDHVVRLDVAEVGVQRGGHLEVGGRAPPQVQPDLAGNAVPQAVVRARSVGHDAVLVTRIEAVERERLEVRDEFRPRPGQRGPAPALVPVRHRALAVETQPPLTLDVGHADDGPGHKELRGPPRRGARRGRAPGTVPGRAVFPLRQQRAVRQAPAEGHLEPEAVTSLPGGVQVERERVPGEEPLVPRAQAFDQRLGRLLHVRADVDAPGRVEEPYGGLERRASHGVRLYHLERLRRGQGLPDGFIEAAVDGHGRVVRSFGQVDG